MITIEIFKQRASILYEEQKKIEGALRELNHLIALSEKADHEEHEKKEAEMACTGKGKGGKKK